MFTGLVQCRGRILRFSSGREARLFIRPLKPFSNGFSKGESIAVNGVCLSVEDFTPDSFSAYASAETLNRSNLALLRPGSEVNLERALRLGDSLGGHLVSGHVDAVCELIRISKAGSSVVFRLSCPEEQSVYIVAKGSVALDGVSLTVNACGPGYFEVNVIPATQAETTLDSWLPGRKINLETDLLAKYVEKMLFRVEASPSGQEGDREGSSARKGRFGALAPDGLDSDFFRRNGYL
ncbi:MAG: riboflavin synthase [Deltaproteobacteria bacterium]|jgi:riboflavin synthase|nr:riboflavin synthase [Deltaproteobacteria bacterium]